MSFELLRTNTCIRSSGFSRKPGSACRITCHSRLLRLNCDTYSEPNIVCIVLYTASTDTPRVTDLSRSTFTSNCCDDALKVDVTPDGSGRFFAFSTNSSTTVAYCWTLASPLL